jgi:hypothetical protein
MKGVGTPGRFKGIGWVAVQEWDAAAGKSRHVSTCRSRKEGDSFIRGRG